MGRSNLGCGTGDKVSLCGDSISLSVDAVGGRGCTMPMEKRSGSVESSVGWRRSVVRPITGW